MAAAMARFRFGHVDDRSGFSTRKNDRLGALTPRPAVLFQRSCLLASDVAPVALALSNCCLCVASPVRSKRSTNLHFLLKFPLWIAPNVAFPSFTRRDQCAFARFGFCFSSHILSLVDIRIAAESRPARHVLMKGCFYLRLCPYVVRVSQPKKF